MRRLATAVAVGLMVLAGIGASAGAAVAPTYGQPCKLGTWGWTYPISWGTWTCARVAPTKYAWVFLPLPPESTTTAPVATTPQPIAAVVSAIEAATTTQPIPSATTAPTTIARPSSYVVGPEQERLFANLYWQTEGPGRSGDPAPADVVPAAIAVGKSACAALDNGLTRSEVGATMSAAGMKFSFTILSYAISFLCPKYR